MATHRLEIAADATVMSLPLPAQPTALFLDFDGTLVDIAEWPDAIRVDDDTPTTLGRLQRSVDGALAIVTGREIDVIDRFLAPFRCPVAGIHGLVRRDAAGVQHSRTGVPAFLDAAERSLKALATTAPGLVVERKSRAIAIHYRARPELERACLAAMEAIAASDASIRIVPGKMVIEAKPGGGDKGSAIADFLNEAPFQGRIPVFVGDDVTDEDGFRLVNDRRGMTVKIGPGPTVAQHRLANPATFVAWLRVVADQLERGADLA